MEFSVELSLVIDDILNIGINILRNVFILVLAPTKKKV